MSQAGVRQAGGSLLLANFPKLSGLRHTQGRKPGRASAPGSVSPCRAKATHDSEIWQGMARPSSHRSTLHLRRPPSHEQLATHSATTTLVQPRPHAHSSQLSQCSHISPHHQADLTALAANNYELRKLSHLGPAQPICEAKSGLKSLALPTCLSGQAGRWELLVLRALHRSRRSSAAIAYLSHKR